MSVIAKSLPIRAFSDDLLYSFAFPSFPSEPPPISYTVEHSSHVPVGFRAVAQDAGETGPRNLEHTAT
jgi:hypothetical protein